MGLILELRFQPARTGTPVFRSRRRSLTGYHRPRPGTRKLTGRRSMHPYALAFPIGVVTAELPISRNLRRPQLVDQLELTQQCARIAGQAELIAE